VDLIAEGIENLMQLRMLQTLKCEYGQGYYFARPMDAMAIESLIVGRQPWLVAFERASVVRGFPFAVEAIDACVR